MNYKLPDIKITSITLVILVIPSLIYKANSSKYTKDSIMGKFIAFVVT